MAGKKIAGVDVLLKVTDDSGVKQIVGGQTNSTLNREAETISVTDKTSGGFTSSIAGLISWSVDCDGFVVLGDTAFDLIEESFMGRKEIEIEIRVGASDNADGVTYTGSGYIVDLPLEFSQDDAVTYALSVEGASPLVKTKGIATA
jgi:TP901-1 family phage major tail protein